jgi:hypothetical protein
MSTPGPLHRGERVGEGLAEQSFGGVVGHDRVVAEEKGDFPVPEGRFVLGDEVGDAVGEPVQQNAWIARSGR